MRYYRQRSQRNRNKNATELPVTELGVCLIGPPRLDFQGQAVRVSRRKTLALVAYLILAEQPPRRDFLANLLWPDLARDRARTDDSQALIRQAGDPFEQLMIMVVHMLLARFSNQPVPPALRSEFLPAARASGDPWAIGVAVLMAAQVVRRPAILTPRTLALPRPRRLFSPCTIGGDTPSVAASSATCSAEAAAVYAETLPIW